MKTPFRHKRTIFITLPFILSIFLCILFLVMIKVDAAAETPLTNGTIPGNEFSKTSNTICADASDQVEFNIEVNNSKNALVTLSVHDELSSEWRILTDTLTSSPNGVMMQGKRQLVWNGVLEAAARLHITYTAEITSAMTKGTIITNTAIAVIKTTAGATQTDSRSVILDTDCVYMPIIGREFRGTQFDFPIVKNSGFENASNIIWTQSTLQPAMRLIYDKNLDSNLRVMPNNGNKLAWLGGSPNETSILSQTITIPNGFANLQLEYFYYTASREPASSCDDDIAQVKVNDDIKNTYKLCEGQTTNGWRVDHITLEERGQPLTIEFYAKTDGNNNSNFFIDDVRICSSSQSGRECATTAAHGAALPTAAAGAALKETGTWETAGK